VPDIVQQVVEQLAGEIQRSLDFYLTTSGDAEVAKVFVSGGTANIRALIDAIEKRARVQVEVMDPLKVAALDPKTVDGALFQQRAAQSAVALGLSLRKDREKSQ
jgi:type IV pilus assembly protein PilM